MKKYVIGIAALILIAIISVIIAFDIGYAKGKNHVIYTQEIYTDNNGYIVVIDGDAHSYN